MRPFMYTPARWEMIKRSSKTTFRKHIATTSRHHVPGPGCKQKYFTPTKSPPATVPMTIREGWFPMSTGIRWRISPNLPSLAVSFAGVRAIWSNSLVGFCERTLILEHNSIERVEANVDKNINTSIAWLLLYYGTLHSMRKILCRALKSYPS